MTTYQDPPLQSRRAVRQGERPETQQSSPFTPPQVPRTAAGAGEPLSYVTQNRPPLPAYDQAPPRGRRSAEAEDATGEDAEQQDTAAQKDTDQPQPPQGFRPRDYSPEARTAPPAWSPDDDRGGIVDYHTQGRADVIPPAEAARSASSPAAAAPAEAANPSPASAPSSLAASLASEPSEQTFTRRELRALRESHGIVPADTVVTPVVPDAPRVPDARPESATGPSEETPAHPAGDAEPFLTRRGRRAAEPRAEVPVFGQPVPAAADVPAPPFVPLTPPPAAESHAIVLPPEPAPPAPSAAEPAPLAPQPAPAAPIAAEPAPFPFSEPVAPPPAAPQQPVAPAAFHPAPAEPASAPAAPAVPATTGERPVGHWTTQSDLDDLTQVSETTISRRVGTGALTTNALVLPSLPGHDMSTGDVMLTGTVALPAALAETGAHTAIDESDIDHLLDPGDHQLVHTDSVPISAFKAVSSHSGNRQQLLANAKPSRGNRALTVLIASASGMVVVVVTLLVLALATDVI